MIHPKYSEIKKDTSFVMFLVYWKTFSQPPNKRILGTLIMWIKSAGNSS
jgi:hypothetical protein